jgi:hypothetical protein
MENMLKMAEGMARYPKRLHLFFNYSNIFNISPPISSLNPEYAFPLIKIIG